MSHPDDKEQSTEPGPGGGKELKQWEHCLDCDGNKQHDFPPIPEKDNNNKKHRWVTWTECCVVGKVIVCFDFVAACKGFTLCTYMIARAVVEGCFFLLLHLLEPKYGFFALFCFVQHTGDHLQFCVLTTGLSITWKAYRYVLYVGFLCYSTRVSLASSLWQTERREK